MVESGRTWVWLQQQLTTKLRMELRVQQGRRRGRRVHLSDHVRVERLLTGHAGVFARSLSFRAPGEATYRIGCAAMCAVVRDRCCNFGACGTLVVVLQVFRDFAGDLPGIFYCRSTYLLNEMNCGRSAKRTEFVGGVLVVLGFRQLPPAKIAEFRSPWRFSQNRLYRICCCRLSCAVSMWA